LKRRGGCNGSVEPYVSFEDQIKTLDSEADKEDCLPQTPRLNKIVKPQSNGTKTAAVPQPWRPNAAGPKPSPRPTTPNYGILADDIRLKSCGFAPE
jgi:hypothetical protein